MFRKSNLLAGLTVVTAVCYIGVYTIEAWAQNDDAKNSPLLNQIKQLNKTINTIVPAKDALEILQQDTSKDLPKFDIGLKVTASRWQWEFTNSAYNYADENTQNSNKIIMNKDKVLFLPKNKTIAFQITSTDIIHPFIVPELGIKTDAIPGRIETVFFNASETGEFKSVCNATCGEHADEMSFTIKIIEEAEFNTLSSERSNSSD